MSRVGGLHGRKVTWEQTVPTHDLRMLMKKPITALIIEHTWVNGDCICICAEPNGNLWTKSTRELRLVESPLASTQQPT